MEHPSAASARKLSVRSLSPASACGQRWPWWSCGWSRYLLCGPRNVMVETASLRRARLGGLNKSSLLLIMDCGSGSNPALRSIPRFQERSAELQPLGTGSSATVCDGTAKRFAQDDGFVGGLEPSCRRVLSFFDFAARKRQQRKGLRPILFNPCSAPATPTQTWGTRPGGQRGTESSAST
jgi:hypothetical protein